MAAEAERTAEDYDDDGKAEELAVWEQPIEKPWEALQEDEQGRLVNVQLEEQRSRKRKIKRSNDINVIIEKGVVRFLYLVLDFSAAMAATDLRPTRALAAIDALDQFVKEFFNQNSISQLGLVVAHSDKAEKVTDLSGSPQQQQENVRLLERREPKGAFSLQSALDVAKASLSQIPSYGTREIVVVMGALGSNDAGDISRTLNELKAARVRVSFVSLSAEVYVAKHIAAVTGGTFSVAVGVEHFRELLSAHIPPVAALAGERPGKRWIHMGFPKRLTDVYPSLCGCHNRLTYSGYHCPRCDTRFCELPTDCTICRLTLISSPHLARSYHHLFPVPPFAELKQEETAALPQPLACSACLEALDPANAVVAQCPQCRSVFCIDCDEYVHEALHNCPGCLSRPRTAAAPSAAAAAAASSASHPAASAASVPTIPHQSQQ